MSRRMLTPREAEVAQLVARGHTNAEIARSLGISVATVKRLLANVMIKWDCRNRAHVAARVVALTDRMRVPTEASADAATLRQSVA